MVVPLEPAGHAREAGGGAAAAADAGAEAVCVCVNIRPLVDSELAEGCKECLLITPGEPQVWGLGVHGCGATRACPCQPPQRAWVGAAVRPTLCCLHLQRRTCRWATARTCSRTTTCSATAAARSRPPPCTTAASRRSWAASSVGTTPPCLPVSARGSEGGKAWWRRQAAQPRL